MYRAENNNILDPHKTPLPTKQTHSNPEKEKKSDKSSARGHRGRLNILWNLIE